MPAKKKAEFEIHAKDKSAKGIRRAEKNITRLQNKMKRFKGMAAGALGVLGGGAAVRSFARMVQSSNDVTDALAKTARKLGVTTEELQSYRHASKMAGVGTAAADVALQRFTRRTSEAAKGTGTALKAFKELGLNAEDLAKKSPTAALEDVAEAFKSVGSQSDKVRLAFALFDTEGVNLVNLLGEGSDSLLKARQDIEDMGLAINKVDAAKVEIANDELTRMKAISSAVKQRIGIELTPAIYGAAKAFTTAGKQGRGMGDGIADGMESAVSFMDRLVSAGAAIKHSMTSAGNGILALLSGVSGFIIGNYAKIQGFAAELITGIADGWDGLRDSTRDTFNAIVSFIEEGANKMGQGLNDVVASVANATIMLVNSALSKLDPLFKKTTEGLNKLIDGYNFFNVVKLPKIPDISVGVKLNPVVAKEFDKFSFGRVADDERAATDKLREIAAALTASKHLETTSRSLLDMSEEFLTRAAEAGISAQEAISTLFSEDGGAMIQGFREARAEIERLAEAATGEGGAKPALDELEETGGNAARGLAAALDPVKKQTDTLFSGMNSAIDQFVENGKISFADLATSIIKDLIKIEIQSQAMSLFSGDPAKTSFIGGIVKGLFGRSFDGGGFTGTGPRSGGVDGKGGFPAIVHPNETVIDHTKGQGGGASVNINQTVYVKETVPEGMAAEIANAGKQAALAALQQIKARGGRRALAY